MDAVGPQRQILRRHNGAVGTLRLQPVQQPVHLGHIAHAVDRGDILRNFSNDQRQIRDPQIPENAGCYRVAFADGKAESVASGQASPDAVMDISTFSALICGVCDWEDAKLTFRGLEVFREAPFSQVFYRKPLMICDFF